MPQRLPIVNSDDGTWGDIIRQFLMKEHYNDDTDNAVNGGHHKVTIRAGTAAAGTAPLKFTSGTLMTTPEAGAIEFTGDNLYFTQTTGPTRKKLAAYDDASGATGDIYYRNGTGYFTRLAAGSAGDFLTIASGIPSWTSAIVGATIDNTSTVTLKDANFTLQDDADTTKQLQFQLSGITTATTRTLTVPNASTTIVGTDVTQTLTNKTLTAPVLSGTVTGTYTLGGTPTFPSTVVSTTGTQTLTNKTINLSNNTFSGTTAQFNTALSDNLFATQAGTETLTNKTINASSNTLSNIAVSHLAAAAVVTEAEGIGSNDNDTTLPTSAAVKDYADNIATNSQAKFMTGTTATAGGTAAKTVTLDSPWASHTPVAGDWLLITYTSGQTASSPTLATNGGTAYPIRTPHDSGTNSSNTYASAGATHLLMFDGSSYRLPGATYNTTYSTISDAEIINTGSTTARLISGQRAEYLMANEATMTRTLTNKTLTGPRIDQVNDDNGNNVFDFITIPSAVNYIYATNQSVGNYPTIGVDGADTNIGFSFAPKGNGPVRISVGAGQTPTLDVAGSDTNIDLNLVPKGSGRVQVGGVNIPSISSTDTLTNKTISGSSNTLSNIPQSAVTNLTTDLAGKAATSHTHTATNISDSTVVGRSVLTAVDAAAARTAIGAGTGSGDVTLTGTQTLTNKTLTSPVLNGTVTGTATATAATANLIPKWDTNKNLFADNFIATFTTTATAAGTTTLTVASTQIQVFTGTSTQTVRLPTTSVIAGTQYRVINNSTGAVTVQSSGTNQITILAPNTSGLFTALVATPTTAAHWDPQYWGSTIAASKTLNVSNSLTFAGTDGTTMTFPGASDTVAGLAATQTFTNKTLTAPVLSGTVTGTYTLGGTPTFPSTVVMTTGAQTLASKTLTSPVINGTVSGTGVATGPTVSTLVLRDANGNVSANAFVHGFTSTATAAGTTTLTITSDSIQEFTGTTTQTVRLPTTSIVAGARYTVINSSTGAVTVQSSGANTISTLPGGTSATFTALITTPTTAANWESTYSAAGGDASTNTASSVDSEVALFSGTDGKTLKRATGTGIATLASGVLGTVAAPSGAIVGTTDTQTLTGKTINLTSNTLTGTTAQFNTALSDNLFATQAGTETLTNKTITAPVLSGTVTGTYTLGGTPTFPSTVILTTGAQTLASKTLTSPVINGTVSGTGVATATTANTLALRDANGNLSANALLPGFTTTATAAGTTTMTIASDQIQVFTGTSTQTVRLPTTSVVAGGQYRVLNNSTGAVTVQSSAGNTIVVLAAGTSGLFTSLIATPTSNTHWDPQYWGSIIASGKTLTASNTLTLAGTDGTTMTFPTTSDTVVGLAAAQTLTNKTLSSPTFSGSYSFGGTPTWPTFNQNTTGSAATLTTARTIGLSGGATGTATSFNGSANITIPVTALNADSLSAGTLPDARMTGTYTGFTHRIDGANTIFTTPNSGSTNTLGRTVYGLAEYRSNSGAQIGAIVFYAPNTTSSIMHQLEISGLLYNQNIVQITVQGYRTTGTWSDTRKISTGTADVQVRWGVDPSGKNCLILGDVGTSWSYPHLSIVRAMFSHTGTSDAYATGWTVGVVTDLTGYTQVTSDITDSAMVGSISGNAATATTLQTARTIGGVSFNGSANINLPGVNTTGNQNTTGSAATLTTARTVQTNLASTSSASFNGSANITPGVTGTLPVGNGGTGATTLTGIIKGNGTAAFTAATAGTDYVTPAGSETLTNKDLTSGTNTWPTFNQNTTGSAATLTTARTVQTNLASTSSASFNGSANITPGVTGTLGVANGGTGRATATTAYGLIAAGTTATGAQQTIAPGTAGQFLKSAGASALASFASIVATDISNSTAVGRSVLTATDAAAARTAIGAGTGDGDVTLTGSQTLTNKTLTNPSVNNYTEGVVAIGTVTTSSTLDLSNGTIQTATLTASTACTFTMPTATAGKSFVLLLKQAASTGNGTATFTGVKWNGLGAPTITPTAGKMDILSFFADGTNWYGSYTQGYTP